MAMRRPSYKAFREQVVHVRDSLRSLNVGFLFLKTVKAFPYSDTNVDVLIPHPTHFQQAKSHFQSQGFRPVFTFEFDKVMLVPPGQSEDLPAIHLYPEISWYTVPYLQASDILHRVQIVRWEGLDIPVPSPEDDYLIYALHAFFEQEALTLEDLQQLGWLRARLNVETRERLMQHDPTVRLVIAEIEAAMDGIERRSDSIPMGYRDEDLPVYTFPERVLLRGFAMKLFHEFRRHHYAWVLRGMYAYGGIHVLKRLRLIRG